MSGLLLDSPARAIQQLLVDLSFGVLPSTAQSASDWPIFSPIRPDNPDSVIAVNDTAGTSDGRSMIDGEQWEHHGIIITVRSSVSSAAYTKSRAIKNGLDKSVYSTSVTVGSNVYLIQSVSTRPGPIYLGFEPKTKRELYTINAVVELMQTT